MELIHTLLFMLREGTLEEDLAMAERCLKSLEKSTYKTVLIYNQGFWDNETLAAYLEKYQLDCTVIGEGVNVGIVAGRQNCFSFIWEHMPDTAFVTELHLDMAFTHNWEDPLVDFLKTHEDEPMICCGIVLQNGDVPCSGYKAAPPPIASDDLDGYLEKLKSDVLVWLRDFSLSAIIYGLVHPCVHKLDVLKAVGGFDTRFLRGNQAFEDDSLLLGYHYYYGTRAAWRPKINCNSIICHDIGGQRLEIDDNLSVNYHGMVQQYGAMGLNVLSTIHQSAWHISFFRRNFEAYF